jgi:hypothetical protein
MERVPATKTGDGGQRNGVLRRMGGGDADDEAAGGDQAIIGAEDSGAEPTYVRGSVELAVDLGEGQLSATSILLLNRIGVKRLVPGGHISECQDGTGAHHPRGACSPVHQQYRQGIAPQLGRV